jgi:O-antigen ligase
MSRQHETRVDAGQERLAFSFQSTVPARRAGPPETFASAAYSEPRNWGYTGLLAFTFVLLFRPQDDIAFLRPFRIAELCALVGIAPMVVHRLSKRLPVFRVNNETIAIGVLGAVMLATVPFSIWPGGALTTALDTFFKVLVVFVLMMNTLTTPGRLQRISRLIFLAGGYVAARGVFDYMRGVNLVEDGRLAGSVSGIFGNPNDLAMNMVCILPLAAMVALSRHNSIPWRVVAAVASVLMIATVLFTKSRGGALSLAIVLLTVLFTSRAIKPAIAVALVASSLVAVPFVPQTYWARMATIFDAEADSEGFTGSREERATLMKEGIDAFLRHPVTGVGAGQFVNYDAPDRVAQWRETHNALIQVASEIGIIGMLALCYLMYRGISTAWILRRQLGPQPRRRPSNDAIAVLSASERVQLHAHAVAMLAAIVGWSVCAMFASVAYSWTFYYLLALTVAARELIGDRIAAGATVPVAETVVAPRHSLRSYADPVRA